MRGGTGGRRRSKSRRSVEERNILVEQWQYLVPHVVRRIKSQLQNLSYEDAIQEGYLGLIRAAELWDETRGVKFVTYSYHVIVSFVLRRDIVSGLIRVPQHHRKGPYRGEARRAQRIERLDAMQNYDPAREENLDDSMDVNILLDQVWDKMELLSPINRRAVIARILKEQTLAEHAEAEGITREGVRQRVNAGLAGLRQFLGVDRPK